MTPAIGTNGNNSLSEQAEAISKCLVDDRLSATPLPEFPVRLPETLEQAYAIQATSIDRWPDEVAGWKVAGMSNADRERFSAKRLAGPVFSSLIRRIEPGSRTVLRVYEGGSPQLKQKSCWNWAPPCSRSRRTTRMRN